MTLVQHRWIQDIASVEKKGDPATSVVDGQPLSKYLKLTKPVYKESSSRGTSIYETTAVLKDVESASDPEMIVDAALKYFMAQAFSAREEPPQKFNIQFYGPGMNSPFFCPLRPTYQNTLDSIKAMFFRLSTSDTLSSIFNTELGIKCSDFCLYCFKKVTIEYHPKHCKFYCDKCFRHGFDKVCKPKNGEAPKFCQRCLIWYNSESCFNMHLNDNSGKRKPLCEKRFFCDKCEKIIEKRNKQHACEMTNTKECKNCDIVHDKGHPYCYLQPETPKIPKRIRYMIYDCETFVKNRKHIANVVVVTTYCTVCMDLEIPVESPLSEAPKDCCCGTFNSRTHIFKTFDGTSAVPQFIDFVFKRSDKTDKIIQILLALNSSKFDSHLLLENLYERNCNLEIVSQGFKLYSVKINVPHLEYYGIDGMRKDEREKLIQWHEQHYNTPFELSKCIVDYCCLDVKVLLKAVVCFRKIMMELSGGLDPFFVASTMAKFAYVHFRANILQPNMLINVGERGYRAAERQSDAALKFFRLYEYKNKVKIQDATWKDGEFKVPDTAFKVDGVIRNQYGTIIKILEFLG
uniref:DNA-directed DNA polymerase n=1 Tax=Panagrolaimus sp. PS1159 TaxID=55785 RepID=A0AC35F342_9BILA